MLRRSLLLIVFLVTGLSTLHAGINDGLVAWYPLDGNADDVGGNGIHGNLVGGVDFVDGISGQAAFFDGSSYIDISSLDVSDDSTFSISFWILDESTSSAYRRWISSCIDTTAGYSFGVREEITGKVQISLEGNGYTNDVAEIFKDGAWHFFALVADGSTLKMFFDGPNPIIDVSESFVPETGLYLGGYWIPSGAEYMEGRIDEVRIYDRALTESEISLLYGLPANTGAGTLRLNGGTLNSTDLSPETNVIEVSSGATISGNVLLRAVNSLDGTVTTPLGYSWSWGDRQSDFTQINADIAADLTDWDVSINLAAPVTRGFFTFLFAYDDTDTPGRLFSCNEAGTGPDWNDGNDLVDLGWDQLDFAGAWGFIPSWSRKGSGGAITTHDLPLAPVFVDVGGATTGSGTIFLTGGTLAGRTLSAENWKIEAEAGETLSGNIAFDVTNNLSGSSRSPLGYTWNWGNRETDLVEINNDINSGTTSWDVPISVRAPDVPGNYALLFGFNGVEFNISQVLSCDNWAAGGSLEWNDGNDYVDFDGMNLEYAHRHGYVPDWQYRMDSTSYSDRDVPIMPVIIHVGEGRIFEDGFEDFGAGAWTSREGHLSSVMTIDLGGGVKMDLIYIPPGTFEMGSPEDEWNRDSDEDRHSVTLTHGYYLGETEVTQAQWEVVMGMNPAHDYGVGDSYPVYYVSWDDICGGTTGSDCAADSFIGKLNTYLGTTKFRLPTEAEWEYAARAQTTGPFSFDTSSNPEWDPDCGSFPEAENYMWWCENGGGLTHPVGSKLSNPWRLCEMQGNLYEWVADWYTSSLGTSPQADPIGPASGSYRILRGGSWYYGARRCRSADRGSTTPSGRYNHIGFRLARSEE